MIASQVLTGMLLNVVTGLPSNSSILSKTLVLFMAWRSRYVRMTRLAYITVRPMLARTSGVSDVWIVVAPAGAVGSRYNPLTRRLIRFAALTPESWVMSM